VRAASTTVMVFTGSVKGAIRIGSKYWSHRLNVSSRSMASKCCEYRVVFMERVNLCSALGDFPHCGAKIRVPSRDAQNMASLQ